jgi:hypothetical protein
MWGNFTLPNLIQARLHIVTNGRINMLERVREENGPALFQCSSLAFAGRDRGNS